MGGPEDPQGKGPDGPFVEMGGEGGYFLPSWANNSSTVMPMEAAILVIWAMSLSVWSAFLRGCMFGFQLWGEKSLPILERHAARKSMSICARILLRISDAPNSLTRSVMVVMGFSRASVARGKTMGSGAVQSWPLSVIWTERDLRIVSIASGVALPAVMVGAYLVVVVMVGPWRVSGLGDGRVALVVGDIPADK